jgi:hypothetical protein
VGARAQTAGLDVLAQQFKPGSYQYTVDTDMSGVAGMPKGFKVPPMTFKQCVTPKDIADGKQFQQGKQAGDMRCQLSNVKSVANAGSYTSTCISPTMQMKSDVAFVNSAGATQFKMDNVMTPKSGAVMKTKSTMTMKWLGPC